AVIPPSEVAIETRDFQTWRVAKLLQLPIEGPPGIPRATRQLRPMGRSVVRRMVQREKRQISLAATGAGRAIGADGLAPEPAEVEPLIGPAGSLARPARAAVTGPDLQALARPSAIATLSSRDPFGAKFPGGLAHPS